MVIFTAFISIGIAIIDAVCDVSQCSVIVYPACPSATACGSYNGKSCAYLPGGLAENPGCGSQPCTAVVGNGGWQDICGGIDALEVKGPCTAQLAKSSGGSTPYKKVYATGFHGLMYVTNENGENINHNAESVRIQCARKLLFFFFSIRFNIAMVSDPILDILLWFYFE